MKKDVDCVIAMLIVCTSFNPIEKILYVSKQYSSVRMIAYAILENCNKDYIHNLINNYLVENKQDYREYFEYIEKFL